ncbi:ubiquitin family protein, partial [Ancylostoma duodenale]
MSLTPVDIWIESVTGERWSERVRLFETIGELKKKVWRRKRIVPSRQAIVFAGRSLPDAVEMDTIGIREGSTLKLVVVARSGPLTGREQDESLLLSDEVSDREYRRRSRRGCSAAEDTSAKESSAGETEREHDLDDQKKLAIRVTGVAVTDLLAVYDDDCGPAVEGPQPSGASNSLGALGLTLEKFEVNIDRLNLRVDSPTGDEVLSEDPSELSSGVIVCDLTNEFRRQK